MTRAVPRGRHARSIAAPVLGAVLSLSSGAPAALAWGATGHEWISGLALESLPDDLPTFLRRPEILAQVAALGREPDRWREAGPEHDGERDAAHMVKLGDEGRLAGDLTLETLPPSREAYDTALRAAGSTQYKTGYLPYAIIDGWQQLVKDFAIWRADRIGAERAADPADRGWLRDDMARREALTVRDLGVWSHFVGDASMPMHVSVHYSGWGEYPNPQGFTDSKTLHVRFEAAFVARNLARDQVRAAMRRDADCRCTIQQRTAAYLGRTAVQVVPLYRFEKAGAFSAATPEAKQFAVLRLAAGASELRDMVVEAWRASEDASVGYPAVKLRDIEAGRIVPTRALYGAD